MTSPEQFFFYRTIKSVLPQPSHIELLTFFGNAEHLYRAGNSYHKHTYRHRLHRLYKERYKRCTAVGDNSAVAVRGYLYQRHKQNKEEAQCQYGSPVGPHTRKRAECDRNSLSALKLREYRQYMSYHGRNKHDREHDLRRIFRVHINKHRQKALSHIAKQRQRTA